MRNIAVTVLFAAAIIALPLVASAQANASAALQQSFLAELQSLSQQLASLTTTINALIIAAGGAVSSTTPAINAAASTPSFVAPAPPISAVVPSNLSTNDLTSLLHQLLTPSSLTSATSYTASKSVSKPAPAQPSYAGTPAIQMDPSCLSGLFGIGGQCGDLYYCGPDIADGYWSSTSCSLSR